MGSLDRKLEEAILYCEITGKLLTKEEMKEFIDEYGSGIVYNSGQFKWLLRGYNASFSTIKEV